MRNHKKKEIQYLIVFIIVGTFLYTFNTTTSRYVGKISSENDIVAVPELNLSNHGISYQITDMLPGDSEEYDFSVSNQENGKTNEVLLTYRLEVRVEGEIPLQIQLFNEKGEEITITEGKTAEERLQYGTQQVKNYKMKILWDESDNQVKYAGQEASVFVELKATQVVA